MDLGIEVNRAEQAVDFAAAVMFAAAAGFAVWAMTSGVGMASVAAAAAFLAARFGLGLIAPATSIYPLPVFPLAALEPVPDARGGADDELILEDRLAEVAPDARVVRLFGPSQTHLRSGHSRPASPDASQALVDALAELRRSLQ